MNLRALTVAATLVAGLWLACGDDYEETGPLTGDVGAKCFPDGTCKARLICLSSLCVEPPDAGVVADTGTPGVVDAANDALVDATTGDAACAEATPPKTGEIACAETSCFDGVCCKNGNGRWLCEPDLTKCPTNNRVLSCDGNELCTNNELCCFEVANDSGECTNLKLKRSTCLGACGSNDYVACDDQHPCAVGDCRPLRLVIDGTTRLLSRNACTKP